MINHTDSGLMDGWLGGGMLLGGGLCLVIAILLAMVIAVMARLIRR